MTAPPLLFDHDLLFQRLKRRKAANADADFLVRRAAQDLAERLAPILRPFPHIADIGTPAGGFSSILQEFRLQSRITAIGLSDSTPEVLESLPQELDLITSGLVLQHANDLPGALVQLRRALRPDGLFIGCLLGGATLTELRQSLTEAESEITGGVSPRVFPFADVRDMGGLLQRAGFALPVTDSDVVTVRYAGIADLMMDLRAMGGANVLTGRLRRPTRRGVFLKAAEIYARNFADADGRIRATFELIWLTGWAPHASQQKPLQPGSARQRLADALKVPEHKAPR